ncbi:MAG: hypothetical protein GQ557_02105, partial [Mycoplasmataceae bacterium]|nr:hypothetical protein [Mycoplasmataceae bacterium]
ILGGTFAFKTKSIDGDKFKTGRMLQTRNRLINENPPTEINLWTSTTSKIDRSTSLVVPSGFTKSSTSPNLSFDYSNFKFTITHTDLISTKSAFILTDENEKILIAVNQDGTLLNVITFDFENKDSQVNYKY